SLKDNVTSGEVEQLPIKESVLDPKEVKPVQVEEGVLDPKEVDSQETKKVANDIEVPVKPKQSEKHYQTNLLDGLIMLFTLLWFHWNLYIVSYFFSLLRINFF
uniref:hypothetical protein n=1 Tax=Ligilactobacillus salivarius TaxID=1624 RepID=UPI002672E797